MTYGKFFKKSADVAGKNKIFYESPTVKSQTFLLRNILRGMGLQNQFFKSLTNWEKRPQKIKFFDSPTENPENVFFRFYNAL